MHVNLKRPLLIAFALSLIVSALIGIFVFLFRNFGIVEINVILTTVAISGFSLAGLCNAIIFEKKNFISLSIVGFVIDVLGFVYSIIAIWNFIPLENIFKTFISLIILTVAFAHISLILLIRPRSRMVKISLYSTITSNIIISLMLLSVIMLNMDLSDQMHFRILGVLIVLVSLGTIVTPIFNKIIMLR